MLLDIIKENILEFSIKDSELQNVEQNHFKNHAIKLLKIELLDNTVYNVEYEDDFNSICYVRLKF